MFIFKKIIVKFLCVFIPMKKWRKSVRKHLLENETDTNWKNIFLEIKSKKEDIIKIANQIEVLFLGSSHTAYNFNPFYFSNNSFNMGTNSQDLFTSFALYNILKDKLSNLKTIFLDYSVFSSGYDLSKSPSAKSLCSSYKYLFDIDYPNDNYNENYEKICKKIDKIPFKLSNNGYLDLRQPILDLNIEDRAKKHLKEHNREIKQNEWIIKLYDLAKQHNVELVLVISPVRADYANYLPPYDVLFENIHDLSKKINIKIINFFNDRDFISEDFYDTDHLNPKGSEKFTKKLKEVYYG